MADIELNDDTRTTLDVVSGDYVQVKRGMVLFGAAATVGSGIFREEGEGFEVKVTQTIYIERLNGELAIIGHEAI